MSVGSVLRHELRANLRGTLVWAVVLGAMTYLMMYLFPSIARQQAGWDKLISQLPQGLLAGFGMDQLRLSNIFGYYGTQIYPLLVLFVAIYAVMLFSGLLAREESEGTIEFLLTRPISRAQVFLGKTLAGLALACAGNAILWLLTWASFAEFHTRPYAAGLLAWFAGGLLLVTWAFGCLGLLLSVYLPRPRSLTSLTIGVALFSYIVGIASAMTDSLRPLRWLSPFQFVDATTIVGRGAVPGSHILGLLGLCAVLAAWAAAEYRTKDIIL